METGNRAALVAFIAGWLASNGHGSAESLIPRVEEGVDLMIGAVREAAENDYERGLEGLKEAQLRREALDRAALEEAGLMPPFREIRPAGTAGESESPTGTRVEEIGGGPVIMPVPDAPAQQQEANDAERN